MAAKMVPIIGWVGHTLKLAKLHIPTVKSPVIDRA
jgi:hypothetical protein